MKKQKLILILIILSILLFVFVFNSVLVHKKLLYSTLHNLINSERITSSYHRIFRLNNVTEQSTPYMEFAKKLHNGFETSFSPTILIDNNDATLFYYYMSLLDYSLTQSVIDKNEEQLQTIIKSLQYIEKEIKALHDKLSAKSIYQIPIIGLYEMKKEYSITLQNINESLKGVIENDEKFKEYLNMEPK
ncbi:hypothetical protein IMX26_07650 [Clostridium sp. 'deep sea']|uniref:hypothetical protein n=1 Tax=Clostridium sp. 'deep sea' TaxID=2779445 RepID=UPI0018965047|nr:hypothetical protein [Clostridium sp. 'deep sea']QOR36670.1 hypothetical protein IMX26_07650 [Clostridium sp. 'deep sea']